MIKPLQMTSIAKGAIKTGFLKIPSAELLTKEFPLVDFPSYKRNPIGAQEEISALKKMLQYHKNNYEKIRKSLDRNFGSDWVFCYQDLNEKQSDMYIACIDEQ